MLGRGLISTERLYPNPNPNPNSIPNPNPNPSPSPNLISIERRWAATLSPKRPPATAATAVPVVAAAGLAVEAAAPVLLPLMSVGGPLDLAPSPLDLPPSPTEDRPSLALTRSSSRPARRSLTALRIAVRGPTPSLVMRDHSGPMLE